MKDVAFSDWLAAGRLRTLPLAVASAGCGGLLAQLNGYGNRSVLVLSVLTAVLLQIFSNLANDYGDARNGADYSGRRGPLRMVASGRISVQAMRAGLCWCALACCLSGLLLLTQALPYLGGTSAVWLLWLLLGISCLAAAFYYTAGRAPYGYRGWGDAAVFVFFGLIGVLGSEYLHGGVVGAHSWLAAAALGVWCSMVLNLNNMRDIDSDLAAGKYTVAARLGLRHAKIYHAALALAAWCLWWLWLPVGYGWLKAVLTAATVWHVYRLTQAEVPHGLDKLLAQWSLTILGWVVLLWLVCV